MPDYDIKLTLEGDPLFVRYSTPTEPVLSSTFSVVISNAVVEGEAESKAFTTQLQTTVVKEMLAVQSRFRERQKKEKVPKEDWVMDSTGGVNFITLKNCTFKNGAIRAPRFFRVNTLVFDNSFAENFSFDFSRLHGCPNLFVEPWTWDKTDMMLVKLAFPFQNSFLHGREMQKHYVDRDWLRTMQRRIHGGIVPRKELPVWLTTD